MRQLLVLVLGLFHLVVPTYSAAFCQAERGSAPPVPTPEGEDPRALLEAARAAHAAGQHARARELILAAIDRALPLLAQHDEPTHLCLCAIGHFAHDTGERRGAERFRRAVLELSERTLPTDHPELQAARGNLAATLRSLGDLAGARALQEAVLEVGERTLPADHPHLQTARGNLAATLYYLGDLHGARALEQAVLAIYERTLPPEHPDLQLARGNLASTIKALGDLHGARALQEAVLEVFERTLPPEHPELQRARGNLAVTIRALGDLHGARALQETALQFFERTLPEEHRDLQLARGNLAGTLFRLGDLHGARALQVAVLEVFERTLPEEHSDLQTARGNLALTIKALGDLPGARALEEAVLEVREQTLPPEHPDLQLARGNLASTLRSLGDLHGARALEEAVLEVLERTLPAGHPELQTARNNLASTLSSLGDLAGARALQEAVLEVFERTLPPEHPGLQTARGNLALTIKTLGDLAGARALEEAVLEVREQTLPPEHPDLQLARGNLASTLRSLGDLLGARALEEAVLEVRERTLPEEHPDLQRARGNLASTLRSLGDLHGARALHGAVLEVFERTLPEEHPDLQTAQGNLASTLRSLGDLHGARALHEAVLEVRERSLPPEHPDLQLARGNLAWTLAQLAASAARGGESKGAGEGEWRRALALGRDAARGARSAAGTTLWTASVREAEDRMARGTESPLWKALSFAAGLGRFGPTSELFSLAFDLSEGTRAAGLAGAALARAQIEPATRDRLRAEIRVAGEELARLAQGGGTRESYHRARSRREAAERELVSLAREHAREGLGALEVGAASLAKTLDPDQALVGFRRFQNFWLEEVEAPQEPGIPRFVWRSLASLGAFVLRAEGGEPSLAFVDLGSAAEVEEAVQAWRAAIGVGGGALDRSGGPERSDGRGIGLPYQAAGTGLSEAASLRRMIWDPLVEALGDARRVVVASDDVLHLVPLDALPLEEEGELVGDRWRVESRVALWELLDPARPPSDRVALVGLGGASFDAASMALGDEDLAALDPGAEEGGTGAHGHAIALLRGGAWERGFAPLAYTGKEVRGLAELFAEAFGGRFEEGIAALVLERARASRESLVEAAPKARFLHVATHGWFAPESVRSWADADDSSPADGLAPRLGGEETVRGMSPMLLCGLALAGANLPADSLGRVPGLMTAEELSTLDLTGCELAVLSACDTNVGERRAGQGVASLQKALHMAGARSVITSLWKVPDEATAELMLDFYRRLWVENKPKHQALWEAKQKLRHAKDEAGRPLYTTRDWAAWVLTGEPD